MEQGQIKVDRAALILRKDRDTLKRWAQEGLIEHTKEGKTYLFNAESVYELRDLMDKSKYIRKPHERISLLELRLKRMERVINSLLAAHHVSISTAISHLSDEHVKKLYRQVENECKLKVWNPLNVKKWATIFSQINESDFARLRLLISDPSPWRPFIQLCNKIIEFWRGNIDQPEYEELSYILDNAKKTLRGSILIYVKHEDEHINEALDDFYGGDPLDRLIDL